MTGRLSNTTHSLLIIGGLVVWCLNCLPIVRAQAPLAKPADPSSPTVSADTAKGQIETLRRENRILALEMELAETKRQLAIEQLRSLDVLWRTLEPVLVRALGGDISTHTIDRATGALTPRPSSAK